MWKPLLVFFFIQVSVFTRSELLAASASTFECRVNASADRSHDQTYGWVGALPRGGQPDRTVPFEVAVSGLDIGYIFTDTHTDKPRIVPLMIRNLVGVEKTGTVFSRTPQAVFFFWEFGPNEFYTAVLHLPSKTAAISQISTCRGNLCDVGVKAITADCRGGSQQAAPSPSIKQSRLPTCPGSYDRATWSNCVGTVRFSSGELTGSTYVGEWKDGKFHGQGTLMNDSRGDYVGEFTDGKRHGQGTFTSPYGSTYIGEFKDDKYHGQGTFTGFAGSYVGEWRNGQYHGQGTYYRADGSILSSGIWENDVFIKSR